jgi:ABC-type sugar transport system permease subunit
MVAPAVLTVLLLIGYPLVSNVWTSLHHGHLSSPRVDEWVGLQHYIDIFRDSVLRAVALHSLTIAGGTALISLVVGFAWALVANQLTRFKSALQVLLMTPWILSGVLAGRLWLWLLDPIFGVVNHWIVRYILEPFTGFEGALELTSGSETAALTVILASVWRMSPFVFVMILAGLQSIPNELYEAAMVDGANPYQRFRHITLPFLRFVLAIVLLLSFVWSFNDFSIILVMTKGGPGFRTMVLPFRVYRFVIDGFRLGTGSALAMIMVVFLSLTAVAYARLLRRQSEEGMLG